MIDKLIYKSNKLKLIVFTILYERAHTLILVATMQHQSFPFLMLLNNLLMANI